MKKSISVLICLISVFMLSIPAFALTDGSYEYTLESNDSVCIKKYTGSETNVVIPNSIDRHTVTEINDSAFANNSTVKSVTIPQTVTFIGEGVFKHTSSLTSISVSPDNAYYGVADNLLYRKANGLAIAYACGSSTQAYNIPKTIRALQPQCFSGSKNLKNVTTNSELKEINYDSFTDCPNLTALYVVNSSTVVNESLFGGSNSTTTIYYNGSIAHTDGFSLIVSPYSSKAESPAPAKNADSKDTAKTTAVLVSEAPSETEAVTEAETELVSETEAVTEVLAQTDVQKKSPKALIICLIIGGVLILGGSGTIVYLYITKKKPFDKPRLAKDKNADNTDNKE